MSVLYCAIPHFAAALARRGDPALAERPLVLLGPEGRVLDSSVEATACGVTAGMTPRWAEVHCPEARLMDADLARLRQESEGLFQLLERASSRVEPHGWGAAYVDLEDLVRAPDQAAGVCGEIGKLVRREMGEALQPALGWDSTKFTSQVAARHARPGRLRAVSAVRERDFLRPLPVTHLALEEDVVRRLHFLGLRTLGQYAALSPAAVWQQFGQPGKLAHRCARGEDDRPVIPRSQVRRLEAGLELEAPLVERHRLLAALLVLVSPLLSELRAKLQACGVLRLAVRFDDGTAQEKQRALLLPTADEARALQIFEGLLDGMRWQAAALAMSVALEQVQDALPQQLTLFPLADERQVRLQEVQRYLAARFGVCCLRRAALAQPGAPLPEWRVAWEAVGELPA